MSSEHEGRSASNRSPLSEPIIPVAVSSAGFERPLPSIRAVPFNNTGANGRVELLTPDEQLELKAAASLIDVRQNALIYGEGSIAQYVYNIVSGVVAIYHLSSHGDRRVTAFLFPSDLMGLAENGEYIATAQALTQVTVYRIPIASLERILKQDPRLDVALLCKLCHDLRRSERHNVVVSQRGARARLASFLLWLRDSQSFEDGGSVKIPMLRYDIADYLGLNVETVSRALRSLQKDRLISLQGPKLFRLIDVPGLRAACLAD